MLVVKRFRLSCRHTFPKFLFFFFIQFLVLIYAFSQRDYKYDFELLGRAMVVLRTTSKEG